MVIAPAHEAGDPGSNPGPGENFSLKLLMLHCLFFSTVKRKRKHLQRMASSQLVSFIHTAMQEEGVRKFFGVQSKQSKPGNFKQKHQILLLNG